MKPCSLAFGRRSNIGLFQSLVKIFAPVEAAFVISDVVEGGIAFAVILEHLNTFDI